VKISMYQVDAFTEELFKGNPAAVCILDYWIDEKLMQSMAAENNLSETAFCVAHDDIYELRWFTPEGEIDLCGHATLATAFVIFEHIGYSGKEIKFETKSGVLEVTKEDDNLIMIFPAREGRHAEITDELVQGLGKKPKELYQSRDLMAVYETEDEIKDMNPDIEILKKLDAFGIIVTAKGKDVDFVSRYFAPAAGIPEDPVTGSAHCTLVPYWSKVLGKKELTAHQISKRGGKLLCEDRGEKIKISGTAVLFLKGEIYI
jgi:PhzF family phenazine biosynthesis protein